MSKREDEFTQQTSGPCFRHFRFDDRGKGVDAFQICRIEVPLHQLDPEVPFDLQHKLQDVDGIDFQFSAEKRLIIA